MGPFSFHEMVAFRLVFSLKIFTNLVGETCRWFTSYPFIINTETIPVFIGTNKCRCLISKIFFLSFFFFCFMKCGKICPLIFTLELSCIIITLICFEIMLLFVYNNLFSKEIISIHGIAIKLCLCIMSNCVYISVNNCILID